MRGASEYSSLSTRTLRRYIGHHTRPLPARLVGGKLLIHRPDLDRWLASWPLAGEDVDRLVDDLLGDIKSEQERRGGSRQQSPRQTRRLPADLPGRFRRRA